MTTTAVGDIRNIAIIGHKGSGKTQLCEAMLYVAKATQKLGKVDDKTSVLDDTAEEKDHACSLEASIAHVLWKEAHLGPEEPARFFSRSGELGATRSGEWIELDFPSLPVAPIEPPDGLAEALGAVPRFVGQNQLYHFVELASEREVRGLSPDFRALGAIPMHGLNPPASTARAGSRRRPARLRPRRSWLSVAGRASGAAFPSTA